MPDEKELSAIDIIYDQINNVLGDTNGEQMLYLTIPGTILDKKTFEYDTRFEKPFKVAANESRLANKLFDPDGGYIYPVTMQPDDWFESLDSNMGFIDLLQTSDVYSMEYSSLQSKRRTLLRKISLFEKNNKGGDLEKLITELNGLENDMVVNAP